MLGFSLRSSLVLSLVKLHLDGLNDVFSHLELSRMGVNVDKDRDVESEWHALIFVVVLHGSIEFSLVIIKREGADLHD